MFARCIQTTAAALLLATSLHAEGWISGALTLHSLKGELVVSELGARDFETDADSLPLSMPGLINCRAPYGASAFFSASNRSYIFFEGDGSFAVERFEQALPEAGTWLSSERESSQSRMILNFRAGQIAVDHRSMLDSSQCLVETPLGRITVSRALWHMRIVFDPRKQFFDFTITCSDGRVRFTDLQGEQYTLRTGQRLSGAGSRTTPSIEVGESTERAREQMELFRGFIDSYAAAANHMEAYTAHFKPVGHVASLRSAPAAAKNSISDRRPIVIEYAKDPTPVTPFRGEVTPPSVYQADLF